MTILGRNAGTFNGTSFLVTPAAGNFGTGTVLVVAVFGNTVVNTPAGWTQRTTSVVDMGLYSYDKAGAGESSISFTNSAGTGEWFVWELSAGSTWDVGSASQTATSGSSQASPSITPTAGNRHILAVVGGNGGGLARNVTAFSGGFTEWADLQVTTQDWTFSAGADLDVTANGSTAYTTTGTYSGSVATRGGITLAYVNATATTPVFPPNRQVRRRLSTAPRLPRSSGRISTPVRAQVNPPFPFTGVKQPRRLRALAPRRGESAMPVPAQTVVTAPKFPPQVVRPRLKGLRLFRGHASAPVPAQAAPVAPAYPPQSVRSRVRGLRLFRGRTVGQVPAQDRTPAPTPPRPRFRGLRVRGDIASPVPPQVVVVPPAYPPQSVRTRLRGLRLFRGHAATPVPPQVAVTPATFVPQPVHTRTKGLRLSRSRTSAPVPAQVVVLPPAYPPRPVRTRLKGLRLARGRESAMPIPAQVVIVVPKLPPLFSRIKQHAARIFRGSTRTVAETPITSTTPVSVGFGGGATTGSHGGTSGAATTDTTSRAGSIGNTSIGTGAVD